MKAARKLTVGTRGSRLALIQAELVTTALAAAHPGLGIEIKTITTTGDTNDAPIPLDTIGKTWFTAEIEAALAAGIIDLAVHSLKDLPPELPAGLAIAPVLERADPRDVLITGIAASLADLPPGATIGTDSLRRRAQILHHRPDLKVASVRGNVGTRLNKLHDGQYDALILAAAGLDRLGLTEMIAEYLDPATFVPAAGQGTLAVEARSGDAMIWTMLRELQHRPTLIAAEAEQAFSRTIGGGCKLPVGCYASFDPTAANMVQLYAMLAPDDSAEVQYQSATGPAAKATASAENLARKLLRQPHQSSP